MVRISFHLSCSKHEPFGTHRSSLLLRKMLFDHVLVTTLLHMFWRLQSSPRHLAGARSPSYPAPLSTLPRGLLRIPGASARVVPMSLLLGPKVSIRSDGFAYRF